MSLTYSECETLVAQIQSLVGQKVLGVSEWDQKHFALEFADENLLLCLRTPFLRFHLVRGLPRTRSAAAKPLQSPVGTTLVAVELLNKDRILALSFSNGNRLIAEFFPKKPNLLMLNSDGEILYSLFAVASSHYQLPERRGERTETTSTVTSEEVARRYAGLELQGEKNRLNRLLSNRLKAVQRRKKKLLQEKAEAEQWLAVQHRGELLQAHFHLLKEGMDSIEVTDWESEDKVVIALDPRAAPQDNVASIFKRARKLRGSLPHLDQQLKGLAEREEQALSKQRSLASLESRKDVDRFSRENELHTDASAPKDEKTRPFYREFSSASGLSIFVGKSSKDNDRLTFSVARGNDWWFHVADYSGSHVILRNKNGVETPDQEAFGDAALIALYYSKAKQMGEADVVFTQVKYVKRAGKNMPGKVNLSQHKTKYAKMDESRWMAIKAR